MCKQAIYPLAVLVVACCLAGCGASRSGSSSRLSTTIGNRTVTALINGPSMISQDSATNSAIVRFGSHTVTVEQARVLLDNAEVCQLPANSNDIELDVDSQGLTILLNGAPVANRPLP